MLLNTTPHALAVAASLALATGLAQAQAAAYGNLGAGSATATAKGAGAVRPTAALAQAPLPRSNAAAAPRSAPALAPQTPAPGAPAAVVAPAAATAAAVAQEPPAPIVVPNPITATCSRLDVAQAVHVPVGKSTVVRPTQPVARILLGNPENARAARPAEGAADAGRAGAAAQQQNQTRPGVADVDVLLLGPSEVYLLGKTLGSTNIIMLERNGGCTAFDVVVSMDTASLEAMIHRLLPNEKEVRVTAAFDSVVLTGTVSDADALAKVTELANAYVRGQGTGNTVGFGASSNPRIVNMMGVGAAQQVMLEVKVAEISKALLDNFGIDFARAWVSGEGTVLRFLSGLFGGAAASVGQLNGGSGIQVGAGAVGSQSNGQSTSIWTAQVGNAQVGDSPQVPFAAGRTFNQATARAQKTDGLVKVLAEPSVMAISGQTGSFLAGGKIFIPVAQVDGGGGRTVTLEEKEFGVSVKFTPTVLGNGLINLKVRPEVSELTGGGITITGGGLSAVLPSFTSRKAETTVQLMDGQSFVIGGLIKNNVTTNVKAFPFLGEIPVLGALFRSTEFQTDRTELVFLITPRLVKPISGAVSLPTDGYVPPSRRELILDGKLEGARPGAPAPAAPAPQAPAAAPDGGFDTRPQEKK